MPLPHCPICSAELSNSDQVTRWCHDIMNHREYWKMQNEGASKQQTEEELFKIVEYYFRQ